ncbi:putative transcription factor C2H2 family [Helianthus annuus]|uniref:Putative zinc finger, RING/FYVE/PHD-type n=1 Tax=Helianthus annuus TaxID=4232 RepID=A0A251TBG8_HELAN|nr:putative transcription factor C2H2 family [Helianthus annuus]KAJ0876085.1 putative transcription factor C2H2 family [Helianthus annuus]
MGFHVGYTDLYLPKLFLQILTLMGLIRKLISSIFRFGGLNDFLEPEFSSDPTGNEQVTHFHSISVVLIRELLPVVKFSELVDLPESCALINCRRIFHQCCLDRWMDHDQKTCPLCRTTFVPHDLRDSFNERLWADSGVAECDSSLVSVRN